MPHFLEVIQGYLESMGGGAYALIAVIVYLETVVVIGQFLPGTLIVAFSGFLCYLQVFDFSIMLTTVFLAHYVGELTNYMLGLTRGRALFREDSRYFKPSLLEAAERHFNRGVIRIIFLSQFTGFFRSLIPLTAGMTRYPLWKFMIIMGFAAFTWSIVHLGAGFIVGASWRQAVHYLESLSLLVLVVFVVSLFSGWLTRKLAQHAGEMGEWIESLSRRIHRSQHYQRLAAKSPRLFGFLEARLSLSRPWGFRATLGLLSVLALWLCFALILINVSTNDEWRTYDLSVVNLFVQLRGGIADPFFLYFTYLGSAVIALPIAVLAALLCLRARQYKSLVVILGAVLLTLALSNLVKVSYARARPEEALAAVRVWGYSFPSGHASLAAALYGALYYWLWNHPGRMRLRLVLGYLTIVFTLLIGFSRVYLGVHFPSDVLGGYCLGVSCMLLSAIVAQNTEAITESKSRADFSALTVIAVGILGAFLFFRFHPQPPPRRQVRPLTKGEYQTTSTLVQQMPREARGLTGEVVVPTDLVYIGDVAELRGMLRVSGWSVVAPNAFFTRQVQAPLFPLFIKGVPADLTLEKRSQGQRLVLRLWKANRLFLGKSTWVGSVLAEKQEPRFLGLPVFQISPDMDAAMETFARQVRPAFCTEFLPGFRPRALYGWSHPFFTHGAVLVASSCRE